MDFEQAHVHSSQHRAELETSSQCGCFSCLALFTQDQIRHWTDAGETALCPHCGIDAVLGSSSGAPMTGEFLAGMCEYWFAF